MTIYYKVCKACKGSKQVMGLGMMQYNDCVVCGGKEKIECETKIVEATPILESQTIKEDDKKIGSVISETVESKIEPEVIEEKKEEVKSEIIKPKKKFKKKKRVKK